MPPAPGPSSVISRIASPCSITALNAPSTAASGWWPSTKAGPTRTSTRSPTRRGPADQLHVHVERPRGGDVVERDALDALDLDPLERDARAEGDRGEDRGLRCGVEPADVLGRVGLGEAESLRLGEGVAVGAPLLHRREDEVRRPVDDPEHAVHVRDDERLAQHLDHRDRGADGCLEPELHAARGGGLEQLRAAAGDELLVRGDDGAARPQQLEHVPAGRVDATHHLGDDLDRRVVEDRAEVVGEDARLGRERPRPCSRRARARASRAGGARSTRSISSADSSSSRCTAAPTVPYPRSATGTSTEATSSTCPRPGASARAAPCRRSRAGTAPPRPASP